MITRQSRRVALTGFLVLLSLALGSIEETLAQSSIDRVRRRTGVDTGKVTKISALEVTVSKNGVDNRVPVEEIESIYFAGEPSELKQARQAIIRGKAEDALAKLKKVDRDSISRAEVVQELDYLTLLAKERQALSGLSSLSSVINLAEEFLSKNRNSYHVSAVIELLGNAQLASGSPEDALRQYRKLAKAPSPYFQARSAILIGRVLQHQEKHDDALKEFEKALAATKKSPAAEPEKLEATLYRAVSQSAVGKVEEATATVEEIISQADASETELLAAAYNALGDCYLQSDKQKAARDAFLHVDVLFSSAADQHAKALYELGKLWKETGHESRAREARERLLSDYPSSRWARR